MKEAAEKQEEEAALMPPWRQVLQRILTPSEKKRIAQETGTGAITYERWIEGSSLPRKATLISFIKVLNPGDRDDLLTTLAETRLLAEDVLAQLQKEEEIPVQEEIYLPNIPSQLYTLVVTAISTASPARRAWTVCQLVLRQIAEHLDPEQGADLTISLLTFTPSLRATDPVRSLSERVYYNGDLGDSEENTRFLLGAESLAGNVCASLQVRVEQPVIQAKAFHPFVNQVGSIAAAPLMRGGDVGGCLLILSSKQSFFSSARQRLLRDYAGLVALAFESDIFYGHDRIRLALMPPPAVQQRFIATVQQRTISLLSKAQEESSQQRAEALAWHEIEEECIQLQKTM